MLPELEKIVAAKRRSSLPNILLAAAECSPLSKTGGLADVAGALPKAMNALGFDVRVITPFHRCIKDKYAGQTEHICDFEISLGWRRQYVGLERLRLDGLTVYLIDNEFYFGDNIYRGGLAEGEQYCFFQRAALECIPQLDFLPEVLHCNDWHTAMLPFLLKTQYASREQSKLKTVLTIHNLAFQGKFGFDFVSDLLGVDEAWYTPSAIAQDGCVNFLKAGCVFADRISTVSPSYADEIKTSAFGEGLEDILISRGEDLCGIINGLDVGAFNPETDSAIAHSYSSADFSGKALCKSALIGEMGLSVSADTPIIAMVTRMTGQKGFQLIEQCFDDVMGMGAAFVLLGTGQERYERFMRSREANYPGRVRVILTYSEELAHRIYAGADFLLMPSAFEPCGLSQIIAMRYGALPIVHEVGGLRDTVTAYDWTTDSGDGFSFSEQYPGSMLSTVSYALSVYSDKDTLRRLICRAMSRDFSFASSAVRYGELYISVLDVESFSAFHSVYDERYRSPIGAVKCRERVTLRISVSPSCPSAALLVADKTYPMAKTDDGFTIEYVTPDSPCVVWYSFRLPDGMSLGADGVVSGMACPFQLTVFSPDFTTPDWAKGAVMYQIFPDRFSRRGAAPKRGVKYHASRGRSVELHASWDAPVKFEGGENYSPNDFYGGTLSGIEASLPEIKKLGVSVIYLNPIFESDSNHRYNTADYLNVDPILGSNRDFSRLCASAASLGIRIILDGVFSHTGDDSVYFNRAGAYPTPGAYQGECSPYYSWYDFRHFPEDYRCWWGFKSLPEVNEGDPGWQDFVITGKNSVIKTWLNAGASGYRLDVADELPDGTLETMRRSVRETRADGLIIGEVWEDATTKISYGSLRRYALGTALDSVMNYPLRGAVIDFVLHRKTALQLRDFLLAQKLNYPPPMYHCLMNLLSSHDTARLRTVLGADGNDGAHMTRQEQAAFRLSAGQDARGRSRQRLCAALQFTLPGIPCIYYGDEEGMQGMRDPFCRAPYRKQANDLRDYYAFLAKTRNASPALRLGDAAFCAPCDDVICVLRISSDESFLIAVNRSETPLEISPEKTSFAGVPSQTLQALPSLPKLSLLPMDSVIIKL